jgi:hypothetical protein
MAQPARRPDSREPGPAFSDPSTRIVRGQVRRRRRRRLVCSIGSPGRLPAGGSHRIRAQPARYFKTSPPPRSRWQRRPKTLGESSGPRRFPRAELESPSRRVEPRGRGSVPTPGHGNRPEGQGPPEAAAQRVNARRPSLRGRLRPSPSHPGSGPAAAGGRRPGGPAARRCRASLSLTEAASALRLPVTVAAVTLTARPGGALRLQVPVPGQSPRLGRRTRSR